MYGVDDRATVDVPGAAPRVPESLAGCASGVAQTRIQNVVVGRHSTPEDQIPPMNRIRNSAGSALRLTTARSRRVEPIRSDLPVPERSDDLTKSFEGGKA